MIASSPVKDSSGTRASRRPGLLVADDEPVVRSVIEVLLQARGFRVWSAGSGREAVQIYRERCSDIDLVLIDVSMPEWDGPTTLAGLRALDPAVRCCFMTGGNATEALLEQRAIWVFHKPFSVAQVSRILLALAAGTDTRLPA